MNDRDIEALFPFYALGTLSDLNEMVEATAELAFLAEPETGTAAEKAALMRRIRSERTTGPVQPTASRTAGFLDVLRRLLAPRPLPALAVLSLLLIVLLGWSLSLRARLGDLNERIAALENDVAALDAERSALQTATDDLAAENAALREQVQSQQQLLAALGRPDTVTVAVSGTEDEPGASGALVLRTDDGQALLAAAKEPTPAGASGRFSSPG